MAVKPPTINIKITNISEPGIFAGKINDKKPTKKIAIIMALTVEYLFNVKSPIFLYNPSIYIIYVRLILLTIPIVSVASHKRFNVQNPIQ